MPVGVAMSKTVGSRTLGEILPECQGLGRDISISGIAYDSRAVTPGDLFFALPGLQADGARFAGEAVSAGAAAVVAERPLGVDAPSFAVDNPRRVMAEASHRFFGRPDRTVKLCGIVGTNGKSTIAAGLRIVLEHAGVSAGEIGTVSHRWGDHEVAASRTTPEAPDLDRLLAQMREESVAAAAVEVSSHAIALERVWGFYFRGGVYTNISRDHLDYHKTFEDYKRTKRQFFERLVAPDQFAAINADDAAADEFAAASAPARLIRYSISDTTADVRLDVTDHRLEGSCGELVIDESRWPFQSPLWGAFNHSNLAAISAAGHGFGLDGAAIASGLGVFDGVRGRLERVDSDSSFSIFVDFAHTPEALGAVLSSTRPLTTGRLLVLFGCGGDRDRGKRPEMARAVEQWADRIYLTSDNPRSENPEAIIEDVKSGFRPDTDVWCDSDRARAIHRVVADAEPGDVVLLCGKGHEDTQEIAGARHRFSDRDVAAQALAASGHSPQASS